jgi:hypothetical protein
MLFTVAMVVIILAISGWAVWLIFRHHRDESAEPLTWGQRFRLAWAHLYRWAGLARAALRELRERFQAWRDRKAVPAGAPTAVALRPPAPRRPAGPGPSGPGILLEPAPLDVTPAEIPAVFGPVLAHISGFEAEHDTDLLTFTRGLAAGDLAMGEALEAQLDHCLTVLRLDPVALQGLADYADQKAEHAQGAVQIGRMINAVYAEIQAFRADGGVLPKDGDWLTGEA